VQTFGEMGPLRSEDTDWMVGRCAQCPSVVDESEAEPIQRVLQLVAERLLEQKPRESAEVQSCILMALYELHPKTCLKAEFVRLEKERKTLERTIEQRRKQLLAKKEQG